MPRIFISYRRDDDASDAGRLRDVLVTRFGRQSVFMDVDSIRPGEEFAKAICETIRNCDFLLVVIGNNWLSHFSSSGNRRLDEADDYVVLEVSNGLKQKSCTVIPVLVAEASMPTRSSLPPQLAGLADRNAVEIRPKYFGRDVAAFIDELNAEEPPLSPTLPKRLLETFFSIIVNPQHRIETLLEGEDSFSFAVSFALTIAAMRFLVAIAAGRNVAGIQQFVSLAITSIVAPFAAASIYHLSFRMLGGRASLQLSMSTYLFLQPFELIGDFCQAPMQDLIDCTIRQGNWLTAILTANLTHMSPWNQFLLLTAWIPRAAVLIRVYTVLYGQYGKLHSLGTGRVILALILATAIGAALESAVMVPLERFSFRTVDCTAFYPSQTP